MAAEFPTKPIFKIAGEVVYFWDSYGIVCPNLFCTRGNIKFFSEAIVKLRLFDKENFVINESILPPTTDFNDAENFRRAIAAEWLEWRKTLTPDPKLKIARMILLRAKLLFETIPAGFHAEVMKLTEKHNENQIFVAPYGVIVNDMCLYSSNWKKDKDFFNAEQELRELDAKSVFFLLSRLSSRIKIAIEAELAETRKFYLSLRRARALFGKLARNMQDTKTRFFDGLSTSKKLAP